MSKQKSRKAPDAMRELMSAFSTNMNITEKAVTNVFDYALSTHLFLPTCDKPFRKIASRFGCHEFLNDLEQLNGGVDISKEIVDSAWARFVEVAYKDERASGFVSEVGSKTLFDRAMKQPTVEAYKSYRWSHMSSSARQALIDKRNAEKRARNDGLSKKQRKKLRLAEIEGAVTIETGRAASTGPILTKAPRRKSRAKKKSRKKLGTVSKDTSSSGAQKEAPVLEIGSAGPKESQLSLGDIDMIL